MPSARARQAIGKHSFDRAHRAVQRQFAHHHKVVQLVAAQLLAGPEHADGDGQVKTRPFLLDIRRREIDGGAAHGKFEPGIGQRRADAVARLLDGGIRQSDDDDDGVAPAAIDLHLDGEGFDAIDGGGENTGQHGRILGEGGREGNAVFFAHGEVSVWCCQAAIHPQPISTSGRWNEITWQ